MESGSEKAGGKDVPENLPPQSKSAQHSVERRAHPRREVRFYVLVRIILEEETLSPQKLEGVCRNIGRDGALVWLPDVPKDRYNRLIQRQRIMRIEWTLPESEEEISLLGRLAWFVWEGVASFEACKLGIDFERLDEKTSEALQRFLKTAP